MLNSRSLDDLTPDTAVKAQAMLAGGRRLGLDILVASTLRDLEAQAVLFRTNRTGAEIQVKLDKLRGRGFDYLADVIQRVGPQPDDGRGHLTNAAPGESWHNYGQALDCYPLVHGKLAGDGDPRWQLYGQAVEAAGLQWAGRWTTFREMPHAQLGQGSNPLKVLPPMQVRAALARWL